MKNSKKLFKRKEEKQKYLSLISDQSDTLQIAKYANSFYACFNKIKNHLSFSHSQINSFVYFLIIDEFQKHLSISEVDKKELLNIFNVNNLKFDQDIRTIIERFKLKTDEKDIELIKKQIERLPFLEICLKFKHRINDIIGIFSEKLITKKETGAYYTSAETTNYIITNTILPKIINKWSLINNRVQKFISFYEKEKNISFIEENIKNNTLLHSFIEIEKLYNTHQELSSIISDLKIVDISCGSGSFIFGIFRFFEKLEEKISENLNVSFDNIYGLDIDREAILLLKSRLILEKYLTKVKAFSVEQDNFFEINSLSISNKNINSKQNKKQNKALSINNFDIILGNPPYIELRKIKYDLDGFASQKCNNLYALFLEKNLNLLKEGGHLGVIVPVSYISTPRMTPIRNLIKNNSKYEFCSSYADRPSCLFNGVHQKLNIILVQKEKKSPKRKLYTSGYTHWYKKEQKKIFSNINYIENNFDPNNFYYKIGKKIEEEIISKLTASEKKLLENTSKNKETKYRVWLNMRLCFWNKSFTYEQKSSEYKIFHFNQKIDATIFSALINSNIYFFFWESISDGWHITKKDLNYLKIDFNSINDSQKNRISLLYKHLEKNLEFHKKHIGSKQTKHEYLHKKDKLIIDELDEVFGEIFNFSKQELNYIKDYQLKYRMNDELDNYLKQRK